MPRTDLVGVVLAGGRSSRLGLDKAALRLCKRGKRGERDERDAGDGGGERGGKGGPGAEACGPDLLERAALLLQGLCRRVLVAGRSHHFLAHVPDAVPDLGPAAGIAAALEATRAPCLVLACDMPFMDAPTLTRLLEARAARPEGCLVTAYRERESGLVQSLAAVYESACLPFLAAALDAKRLALQDALPAQRWHYLSYSCEGSLPFFNLNCPEDLEQARKIMHLTAK